jgi:tRNA (guanine-N7-)-methyltransferase
MTKKEFEKKWIKTFAKNVSKKDLKKRVLGRGNFLWHIFSWDLVPCKVGDEARKAFDRITNKNCLSIQMWIDEELQEVNPNCKSADFDYIQELFIVDSNFKWTYVVTHEGDLCGPYFSCI